MTCVVGVRGHHATWIGADRAVSGNRGFVGDSIKLGVFGAGKDRMIMGGAGPTVLVRRVLERLKPTGIPEHSDIHQFVSIDLTEQIRRITREAGYDPKSEDGLLQLGVTFLIALRGRLFLLNDDQNVLEFEGSWAIGTPYEARGSLRATMGRSPRDRVETALSVAAYFNPECIRGPFDIESA